MNAYAPLDLIFEPKSPCLTPEGARRLAALRSDELSQARMAQLAEKANDGLLTAAERREYEGAVRAGTLLSLLQAKARLYLRTLE
jgi:hypothetical protein